MTINLFLPVMRNYLIVYTVINDNIDIVRSLTKYKNICAILKSLFVNNICVLYYHIVLFVILLLWAEIKP